MEHGGARQCTVVVLLTYQAGSQCHTTCCVEHANDKACYGHVLHGRLCGIVSQPGGYVHP